MDAQGLQLMEGGDRCRNDRATKLVYFKSPGRRQSTGAFRCSHAAAPCGRLIASSEVELTGSDNLDRTHSSSHAAS
jgi:hypothetical protein